MGKVLVSFNWQIKRKKYLFLSVLFVVDFNFNIVKYSVFTWHCANASSGEAYEGQVTVVSVNNHFSDDLTYTSNILIPIMMRN